MRISTGELKQVHIEEKDVRSIMKSLTNIRNDGTVRQGGNSTNIYVVHLNKNVEV